MGEGELLSGESFQGLLDAQEKSFKVGEEGALERRELMTRIYTNYSASSPLAVDRHPTPAREKSFKVGEL